MLYYHNKQTNKQRNNEHDFSFRRMKEFYSEVKTTLLTLASQRLDVIDAMPKDGPSLLKYTNFLSIRTMEFPI